MIDVDERTDEPRVTRLPVVAVQSQIERVSTSKSNIRWLVWLLIAGVTVAILVAGYVGWWYVGKIYPESTAISIEVDFVVGDDDTVETVADRLYQQKLISDPDVFEWYVDRQGGLELTPGFYRIESGVHMGSVLERLRTPPDQTYRRVTFPEGFTVSQMGERLEEVEPRLKAATFDEVVASGQITSKYSPPDQPSLEGLLFPDTYRVSNADNEGQVVEKMVVLMERTADGLDIELRAEELGYTPYQIIIIASIIEREAKLQEDRSKIARVIYNRLFLDIPLEIDATLYYGQPGFEGSFADLRQIDTPYNSYLYKGLPPTPISNPGRASIEAALNPIDNPTDRDAICKNIDPDAPCLYLYYVLADTDGSHVFAATPEQHQANVDAAAAKGLL